jgi:hypothetical protein
VFQCTVTVVEKSLLLESSGLWSSGSAGLRHPNELLMFRASNDVSGMMSRMHDEGAWRSYINLEIWDNVKLFV